MADIGDQPAFPRSHSVEVPTPGIRRHAQTGMTLLEYYAGQAMVGLICSPTAAGAVADVTSTGKEMSLAMAEMAWQMAESLVEMHPDNE